MNARLFCVCKGALGRPRPGEAGALILRAEEPGFGDAGQADGAAVWIFSDHRTLVRLRWLSPVLRIPELYPRFFIHRTFF